MMKFQHTRRGETQKKNYKNNCHSRMLLSGITTAFNNAQGGELRLQASGMTTVLNNMSGHALTYRGVSRGFTLIELLVVGLIIGILAAVALPQYQKAVERSKATQGITLLKTLTAAYQAAYLANGNYPSSFAELDIDFPFTGNEHFLGHAQRDSKSNSDWILEIEKTPAYVTLYAMRNSGKYKGAGFLVGVSNPRNNSKKKIQCYERTSVANFVFDTHLAEGAYCQQVMQGSFSGEDTYGRAYNLP